MRVLPVLTLLAAGLFARAEDAVRPVEKAPPGSEFRVESRSSIAGELFIPTAKDKPPEKVKVTGKSELVYFERALAVDPKEADHKALRVYEEFKFTKTTGDRTDETFLRPAVRRLVIQKQGAKKSPFSPDGPLLWAEIEAVRTDLVVQALAGLLPGQPVRPGDSWKAADAAVVELTDMDRVTKGELTCTLDKVEVLGPRQLAQVSFRGTLDGVNEDGPTRQELSGRLTADLGAECITFLEVTGAHILLDGAGKEVGRITGTYNLVRRRASGHADLADEALKGLELDPSEANTRLLYDNPALGIRFAHSRNWRVVRTNGRQVTLDESNGAGLLITLEAADQVPMVARFKEEAIKELQQRGGRLTSSTQPVKIGEGVERITLDAEIGEGRKKDEVTMDYIVVRRENGGATLAARVPARQREARMKELERLARSFQVTRRLDAK